MGWDVIGPARQPYTRLDATPFIGLVLVLLIIQMVVTPAVITDPYLPRAAASEVLQAAAGTANAPGQEGAMYLKSHAGTDYAVIEAALAAARSAGIRRVGLITEPPKGTPAWR